MPQQTLEHFYSPEPLGQDLSERCSPCRGGQLLLQRRPGLCRTAGSPRVRLKPRHSDRQGSILQRGKYDLAVTHKAGSMSAPRHRAKESGRCPALGVGNSMMLELF